MYPLFIFAPIFVGGTLALIFGVSDRAERYSKHVALAGALGSSILSILLLLHIPSQAYQVNWFSLGQYAFQLSLSLGSVNQLLLLLVAIISPLIFLYSVGYMDVPSEQSRYYFELSLFTISMMLLAMSGGFLTFFVAWEGLGITSYLLIGFWYYREAPPSAARKAITTVLIGDICMLAGILLLWSYFHSFGFAAILSEAAALTSMPALVVIAALLILVGAFTKSAQFPFHEWLSDAMEGPTPVSAFLHSSTMVKAGVFLIILLLPLFVELNLLWVMLVIGALTAVIGAVNALTSDHIKKILAYSTMEDLGLMFVALGLNALPAALIFFAVQAVYKALMLMSAGTIMKSNDDSVSIYKVSSFGRNRVLFACALIGALSIAGIFPFSGFFGKVAVDSAASSNAVVYAVLTVVDFLTALYIFRWLFIPMENQKKASKAVYEGRFSALKKSMQVPQVILAAGVLAFTVYLVFDMHLQKINIATALVATAASLFGILAAYLMFKKTAGILSERSHTRLLIHTAPAVNAAYSYIAFAVQLAALGVESFDRYLNRLLYVGGRGVLALGGTIKITEKGNVNAYIAALAIGMVLVLVMLVLIP